MYVRGYKVGYVQTRVREFEREGKKYLYATKYQKLIFKRFGDPAEQWAEDATQETADGTVLTTLMQQGIGRNQVLSLTGKVDGRVMKVEIKGAGGGTKDVPWPDGVVGIAKEATLLKDRKPKPGDTFEYLYYEGRLALVVKFTAKVKDVVTAPLADGQKPRKLLPVELAMEPIGDFKLPVSTLWADPETFEPLKMESDMPMFGGKLTILRTSRAEALRQPPKLLELFETQSIQLDRQIPDVHGRAGVVYRVKLGGDLPLEKAFARDDRQEVRNVDAANRTLELHVTAVRSPQPGKAAAEPGKEYLSSNFFIDWDDDLVKRHARQAVEGLPATATAWQKAVAVEGWVRRNMRQVEFSQAMATCANVAKTLSGDCTEAAMLAAGMCRALDIPSRTAVGVVYAPSGGKPVLAYHMWFEVFADGQWVGLDGILGMGSIGPGHVKISDASWHDEKSFVPLLPLLAVLGSSPKVDVLRVIDPRR
jgi:transglutaminase-like putative cysteine protease